MNNCVLINKDELVAVVVLVSCPDSTKKRSGEPSQISWASAHFCNKLCNLATIKIFCGSPTQKRYS